MRKLLILSALFMFSCGTFTTESFMNMGAQVSSSTIQMVMPSLIEKSINEADDKRVAEKAWQTINQMMKDQVLPMLDGQSPTVSNLKDMFELTNLQKLDGVSDTEIQAIQSVINVVLSYVPFDKWQDATESNVMSKHIVGIFYSSLWTVTWVIDDYFKQEAQYIADNPELADNISGSPAMSVRPPDYDSAKVTTGISFNHMGDR